MVRAKVLKKIPRYGYYVNDIGTFDSEMIGVLVSGKYIELIEEQVEVIDKPKNKKGK